MLKHHTIIASHRGCAFLWPENGLAAFRQTAMLPLEQAECDVHPSADGAPVVIHDSTLDRTTDGRGPVAVLPTAELRRHRLKGGGGEVIPLLSDVLEVLRPSAVAPRVEVKTDGGGRPYPGFLPRVLAEIDRHGMRARTTVIAFDAPTAAEAMAAGGLAGVAWLLEGTTWRSLGMRGTIAVAQAYGLAEIGVHEASLDAEAVAALRGAGLRICVWGANHNASIRRSLGLGVNVLTTDDPPLAIALRDRHRA